MKTNRWLLILLVSLTGSKATIPAQSALTTRESFVRYAGVQSVTGREARFIEFLKEQLPAGVKSEIDNMGNLIVRTGGDAEPQLMIVTSVDEPGFLVTDVTEEGFLRVALPGGRTTGPLFAQFHEGHLMEIAAREGMIRGVVALPSSHLVRGRRESLTVDRMLIDIGARSEQEAMARGVEMLNPAAAVKDIALLAENRLAGPLLSRKFGALALVEALKGTAAKTGKGVIFAWATQSTMSNSGVARLARRFQPKQVLAVAAFQRAGARADKGPVEVLDSGVLVPDGESPGGAGEFLRAAMAAAGQRIRLTASATGASVETRVFGTGVDAFAAAIPVAYPGSLVETIDLDDLQQLIEFIKIVAGM